MELRNSFGQTEEEFLRGYQPGDYERPSVTVDMPIFTLMEGVNGQMALHVLLIQRKNHPCMMQWALPGGFVDPGESTEDAARRELVEETGIEHLHMEQFHTFSTPGRDPRTWVISCAYVALADGNRLSVQAGDDAAAAAWFQLSMHRVEESCQEKEGGGVERTTLWNLELKHGSTKLSAKIAQVCECTRVSDTTEYRIVSNEGLAFDHSQMITMAWMFIKGKVRFGKEALHVMPERFTMAQLFLAYELLLNEKLTYAEFERMAAPYVEKSDCPGFYKKKL